MKGLFVSILARLKRLGADYADIRHERITTESLQALDGEVEGFSTDISAGVGIRVLYRGAWGFAATNVVNEAGAMKAAEEALAIARAFSAVNADKVRLSEAEPFIECYSTPYVIDPFGVAPERKISQIAGVTGAALKEKGISSAEAFLEFSKAEKEFCSTEGAVITQTILTSGGGYHVIAGDGDDAEVRSYPDGHHGLFATRGYELIDELDFMGNLPRVIDEARSLVSARECPTGARDIIIDGPQLALQIHESCGHPSELDRVLGAELGFAGGSFLTLDKLGAFRYGSPIVNIYADPNEPFGAGSYRFDDEGVRGIRVDLVREGVFTGYLTSRETAPSIGGASNGSMRGEGWGGLPIIRMSNICMEPGKGTLEDLISDTKDGLFLSVNRSWSIDDKRLNFQFGSEIAWEIRNGKLGQAFRNPVYYGTTPRFWASCDAVCGKDDWRIWGLNSCAKGEPMQTAHVGHGASPARFKSVEVGVRKNQ